MFLLPQETQLIYKFENLQIVLKNPNSGSEYASIFQKIGNVLSKEGPQYSINRESFIKFFNELSEAQQKEFLSMVSSSINQAKTIYDIAQEYKIKLMQNHTKS